MVKSNENHNEIKQLIQENKRLNDQLILITSINESNGSQIEVNRKKTKIQENEKVIRVKELAKANQALIRQTQEIKEQTAEIIALKDAQIFVEKQLFEKTLLSIGDGVISTDARKNIMFMNHVAEELTGWTMQEATGLPIYQVFNIINEFSRLRDNDIIEEVISSKTIRNLANHTILKTKNGAENLIEDSAAPILDIKENLIGVVVVFRDYTEKWERMKRIDYLNFHDDLTGLFNRRYFEEELLRLDVLRNLPISIIMGDINGLKLVNDSFGHLIGDELLIKTANAIRLGCRADEIVARIGGDEFIVLIPNCHSGQAEAIINRIKTNMTHQKVNKLDISVSFGSATKINSNNNIYAILKQSEDMMYKHKLSESSSTRSRTVDLITKTLFEKNLKEMYHSQRVSQLGVLLATGLGFDADHINVVKMVGLMHDIGKIGIEDAILNKNGKLTDEEYLQIKKHPEIGFRIMGSVAEFVEISTSILHHHEWWNGDGYPQGLQGENITIDARIIAVVDAFDAMTSERTYRNSMTPNESLDELTKCAGTQFDPVIVKTFTKIMRKVSKK